MSQDFFAHHLESCPVMLIIRGESVARTLVLCERAWALGIALVEIPLQGEESTTALREAVLLGASTGRLIGAGTIISSDHVRTASDVGAAFTVAPGFSKDVASASRAAGLPHLAGVATASDVQAALASGHVWQKAFPASVLGDAWVTAMRGPFPDVRFVATGGIGARNARAFLQAGAGAVSLGSSFESATDAEIRAIISIRADPRIN